MTEPDLGPEDAVAEAPAECETESTSRLGPALVVAAGVLVATALPMGNAADAIAREASANNPTPIEHVVEHVAPAHATRHGRAQARRSHRQTVRQSHPRKWKARASWYGPGWIGKKTANGEVYTGQQQTAAHPSLPFGTLVQVTNLKNGRSAVVRINDRGPYKPGRDLDLSEAAAKDLGMMKDGVVMVRLAVVGHTDTKTAA